MFNMNLNVLFHIYIFIFLFDKSSIVKCEKIKKLVPEDMFILEELIITRMKSVWNITNNIFNTLTVTTEQMHNYTLNLCTILQEIHEELKIYDRKIIAVQPDKLLNRVIDLQELDRLQVLSDNPTSDPYVNWKVKWVEVSSLSTHIHWLYNKRIRDILTRIPYIKTVATSIAKYYGNPWHSVLSGNSEKQRRVPIRYFARLIDERLFSVPQGDLFYGLSKLLKESKTGKVGSAVKPGTCEGEQLIGKMFPVRLDSALYVLFYLCLVDFKFYILENYFQIYQEAYEGVQFLNYSTSDDRLRMRIRRKVDSYNLSFQFYKLNNNDKKIMTGYFTCDPPSTETDPNSDIRNHRRLESFIKITNFLTVFATLEKTISPSGRCDGTCIDFGKGLNYCKKGDPNCLVNLHHECEKNPGLCDNFTPSCPVQYLICSKTAMKTTSCSAVNEDRMYDWIILDDSKVWGHRKGKSECEQWTTNFTGTIETIGGRNHKCEVCLCQCLEPIVIQGNTSSVRLFSMNEVVSRINKNRVIIGIKFEQVDDQIHFMIADAVSLPGFMVDLSTISWTKPNISDPKNPDEIKRLSKTLKTFHLDDLKAFEGYVITGIKFIEKLKGIPEPGEEQLTYLGVTVQTTRVDATTGDLDESTSTWMENLNTGTTPIYSYVDPDDPVRADGSALPDSTNDQFIDFRTSSFKKDAGQTVVPFFDSQKMIMNPQLGFAIRGIGIYHKQKPGFGGFLGIKILPYGEYNPF